MQTEECELRSALAGTALEDLTLKQEPGGLWLLSGADPADLLEMWRIARGLVPRIGRWPVAVDADPFYLVAPPDARLAADELAAAADAADPREVFPARVNDRPETVEDLARLLAYRFPRHPELAGRMVQELSDPTTEPEWDAWLYELLIADADLRAEVEVGHLRGTRTWYRPPRIAIALLPDARGWLAPAFLSFHSCETGDRAAGLAAVQRRWEQDYRAELVAHWGTMLQYTVGRPPQDPADAYRVAGEHKDIASSLQMYRYELALALPGSDAWFLHDRP